MSLSDKELNVKFPGRLIPKGSSGATSVVVVVGELHTSLKCRFDCRVRFDMQVQIGYQKGSCPVDDSVRSMIAVDG